MPKAQRWLGISLGANVLLAIVAAIGWWRDAMSSLDDDDAAAPSLSPFQALLWRLEHGLPPGPAPDFHRMPPIFDR